MESHDLKDLNFQENLKNLNFHKFHPMTLVRTVKEFNTFCQKRKTLQLPKNNLEKYASRAK